MKRKAMYCTLLALLMTASSCTLDPMNAHLTTNAPETPTYMVVTPNAESAARDRHLVTLYFQYGDSGLLSTESRHIETGIDSQIEKYIIEELINGPSAEYSELRSIIPSGTRVMDIEERDGMLFITLSNDFLTVPSEAPTNWESDDYWAAEIPRRRLLALQSIVCAITDLGEYSSIQLLIDRDNDGEKTGERIQRYYFYREQEKNVGLMLDVMRRDEDVVLTPRNLVSLIMTQLRAKNFDGLYSYISFELLDGDYPTLDETAAQLQQYSYTLVDFTVGDVMVSGDGQSATVCVDVVFSARDGAERRVDKFPIRLLRSSEIWKVDYNSVTGILEE